MKAALQARIDEMNSVAERHGWTTHHEMYDVEGCTEAVAWGATIDIDGYEFMCIVALGINPRTGRVITLRAPEQHDAAIIVEVEEPTIERKVGRALGYDKRFWWSKLTGAWKGALADPMAWCAGLRKS